MCPYRFAKRKMDNANYCGGELHVFYAPEYESVDETRAKLQDRRRAVSWRLRLLAGGNGNFFLLVNKYCSST